MLRHTLPLCFLLAINGCGDAPKAPPSSSSNPIRELPEAVKPEGAPTAKLETAAKETVADDKDSAEMAEGAVDAKPDDADDDAPADETAAADKKKSGEDAKDDDDEKDDDKEKGPTVQEAFAAMQKLLQKGDMKGGIAELEKALPANPDDASLLVALAQLNLNVAMSDPKKSDYARYTAAAGYVRRLLKGNPALAENPGYRNFAGTAYYNEACALAVDKKTDDAMKVLQEAADMGFHDFALMEKDADLEEVRALPNFSEFLTTARAGYREHLKKEVDDVFAATKAFDFDFELTDIEGNAIAKADFKGKVLIVDVWGTWCPPCRAEVPHFVALVKKFKEEGLEIVGLNSEGGDEDEALKKVQEFHKENGMNYRCALVKKDTVDQIPEMQGYPTTLFFDRAGKVRAKVVGLQDYDKLEAFVTSLLEEKSEEAGG